MLRDQLVTDVDDLVSPDPDVALIDEADSVLVDEALVPLVLAGTTPPRDAAAGDHPAGRRAGARARTTTPTPTAATCTSPTRAPASSRAALGGIDLYSEEHVGTTLTEVNVALHAHVLLQRDVHYIVRDDAVQLINASRGRIAQLQRWPDGLQAAVEAKEGIETTETGEVLDTITVQALINRYPTGVRDDRYRAGRRRAAAPVLQARRLADPAEHAERPRGRGRPGLHHRRRQERRRRRAHQAESTRPASRCWSAPATSPNPRNCTNGSSRPACRAVVLNAKNDAEEAARHRRGGHARRRSRCRPRWPAAAPTSGSAGPTRPSHDEVAELGGLHVIGTGRHHTERLDNQLRGRAGRQGDPGSSVFFSSWEDDVVVAHLEPREAADCRPTRTAASSATRRRNCSSTPSASPRAGCSTCTPTPGATTSWSPSSARSWSTGATRCCAPRPPARNSTERSPERYEELAEEIGEERLEKICRLIMLYHLDRGWADHLAYLSDIRESIHLRALGRQNPLDEFHRMAVDAFASLAADAIEAAQQTFETANVVEDEQGSTCRSWRGRPRRGRT